MNILPENKNKEASAVKTVLKVNCFYDQDSGHIFEKLGRHSLIYAHYEKKLTKSIRQTDILQIYTSTYLVNVLKFTKMFPYLLNV